MYPLMAFPHGDFRTNNLEFKQSKNWKLQDTGRKGEAMFALVFCASERFRIRPSWVVFLNMAYCATGSA